MNGLEHSVRRVLVVAPHPDDEVLGCGGTIARLAAAGAQVEVCVVTRGRTPPFDAAMVERVVGEAKAAHALLGVTETHWLELPAAALDRVPVAELNAAIGGVVARSLPEIVLVPFVGDMHFEHRLVFEACLVACRPLQRETPRAIWCYETLSETNWNAPHVTPAFIPQLFVDITAFLPQKLAAMELFASQVQPFPHERSLRALESLARLRGATVCREAAEAFVVVRQLA